MSTNPPKNDEMNALGCCFVLLTCIITFGVALPLTLWLLDVLDVDSIPKIVVIIPSVGFGIGFWIAVNWICERLGISLSKPGTPPREPLDPL